MYQRCAINHRLNRQNSEEMKSIHAALFMLLTVILSAQSTPFEFANVVQVEGATAAELAARAKSFVVDIYKNPQRVIQSEDDQHITVKGSFPYTQSKIMWGAHENTRGSLGYTLSIFCKDGRYKYEMSDFIHDATGSYEFGLLSGADTYQGKMPMTMKKWRKNIWDDLKVQSTTYAEVIISSIKDKMQAKTEVQNSDW